MKLFINCKIKLDYYVRLIATAQSAALSPFGFDKTNLYAPQSDG